MPRRRAGYEGIYHAPKGVVLESDAEIGAHAREIYLQAGRSHAMPPGNVTEVTSEERALLVAWFEERALLVAWYEEARAQVTGSSPARGGTLGAGRDLQSSAGRTLTFLRWPETAKDLAACRYEEDGALMVDATARSSPRGPMPRSRSRPGRTSRSSTTGRT